MPTTVKKQAVTWVALVLGATLVVLLVVLSSASPAPADPNITWTPAKITKRIATGGVETMVVSLTTSENIKQPVTIGVVPELQRFVKVIPDVIPSLVANQPMNIRVIFSAASDAPLGSFEGTAQIRNISGPPKVLSKPLPITVTTCRCGSVAGVSLTYPIHWQSNLTDRLYSPNVLRLETADAFSNGGVLNEGAAAIVVSKEPLPSEPLTDVITDDTLGTKLHTTETVYIAGLPATRITYTDRESPVSETWSIAVYIPSSNLLYRFLLTYHAGDPHESEFLTDFESILASVRFNN
jgi:hypothetical protein